MWSLTCRVDYLEAEQEKTKSRIEPITDDSTENPNEKGVLEILNANVEDIYKNIGTTEMYLIVDFDSTNEISSREISSNKKGCNRETRYDAQFATILQLMSD